MALAPAAVYCAAMSSARAPLFLLGLALTACTNPGDEGTSSSSDSSTASTSTDAPTTTGTTGTPTTGTPDTSSTGPGEVGPDPLPPLTKPVPLTTDERREPSHPVDAEQVYDPRLPADLAQMLVEAYDAFTLTPGEPVLPRTLDDGVAPGPGAAPKLLTRFVHLADAQLSDDESPARLVNLDQVAGGAFRPQEGHYCRMLNASARTINRLNEDLPLDFVLLGGDNTDNAQTNELEWFMGILDGAPKVECDSAEDNDLVPGPDNDQKDAFGPVGLDVPWRWVTGNHDLLRQGTWATPFFAADPIGDQATGGTRDYSQPGSPIVTGKVLADPNRAFISEADQLQRIADAGDGHGIDASALALGRANYSFDIEGTPLRVLVISTASATGASTGLIRQLHIDTLIEPALQDAAAADKLVIITSHHRAASLNDGTEPQLGVGQAYPDALTGEDWVSYLGTHPHVIMHLAAHTHTMSVIAQAPLGGHAFWEVTSPSLADFPHQLRMLEVWDQDNGFLTIRTVAFDIVTDGDPIAETGRTLGYADYTSAWNGDGRGKTANDRNVELWIEKP